MVGGLALFLFGMDTMGKGLAELSGGRMERMLEKLTNTRIMAVLLGAGVTAVIQSSSATTVMVVGFVNSGIMKLSQAIGIILGANVGTTVTSWILSLSGIEGTNFFIRLLKPASFAPVLAAVGIVFSMFSSSERKKGAGSILLGFTVLMFGMETMSGAVAPLTKMAGFSKFMITFSNPVLGLVLGALLTAIIQSSSASIGILQALCLTGAVRFSTAIPVIMGQNIGTCITAVLSSVGANKNAKRAAMVHLYFNLIGTGLFMIGFYSINAFVNFKFLNSVTSAADVAIIHTLFNVAAVALMLPFADWLEWLAKITIADKKSDTAAEAVNRDFARLDERFLQTPGFAVKQAFEVGVKMAGHARQALFSAIDLLDGYEKGAAADIKETEKLVDKYEDVLGSYLVKLGNSNLSQAEGRTLSILLHCIGEFERISDHAVNIMQASREMHEKQLSFSAKARAEIHIFQSAVMEIVDMAIEVFANEDTELAKKVEPLEEVIDNLNFEERQRHIRRLREGKCSIELGFILADICNNFERIADHCSNIAVCVIEVNKGEFGTHEYLYSLKDDENGEFRREYKALREKYMLP